MKNIPKFVKGLDPIADAFTGSGVTDIISMKNHQTATFLIYVGVETAGTADGVVTVHAVDDVAGSNATAIPFKYQTITSGDTPSAITDATATGYVMTAGSSQINAIYVDAGDLASTGYGYVRLTVTEDTNDPAVACILCMLTEGKEEAEITETAIV